MNSIAHIRKRVFQTTQTKFGELAGVTQATVSKWECGELAPGLREMSAIREAARAKGIAWEDSWLFDPPVAVSSCPELHEAV